MFFAINFYSQEVGLVANFPFNNSNTSTVNSEPFLSATSFTTDRNGVANNALSRSTGLATSNIANLPFGNSARTISVWFKRGAFVGEHVLLEYGSGTSNSRFFISFNDFSTTYLAVGAPPFYNSTNVTLLPDTWYHYVVTTNSSGTIKHYLNGNLLAILNGVINTAANNFCSIDGGYGGAIDDLKIYNRELSAAEVLNLYTNNTSESPVVTVPTVNVNAVIPSINTAQVNYTINANNANTSSVINYGLTSGALLSQSGTWNASGNSDMFFPLTLTGLAPNTLYYFQVEATNSAGTTNSAIQSFTTLAGSTTPIAEYLFNGSVNNVNGTEPFDPTGTYFTTDRFGATNSAIFLNGGLPSASITNLPVNHASRTISVWIKPAQVNADNIIFTYGSGSGNYAYGASFSPTIMYNFSYSSNLAYSTQTFVNNWKHMVYTFDYTTSTAKIFINGSLVNSGAFPAWSTSGGGLFYLGNLFGGSASAFNGAMDDLKIYNRVLSDSEVLSLYNNNTLSSSDFTQNNLDVALYPNPANNVLNIETALEIQNVEIYNIQGQKVLSSNQKQINVSDLAAGMYMVRIQDTDNNIATKKIVIK